MVTSNALRRSTLLRSTLAGRNPEDRICFCTSPKILPLTASSSQIRSPKPEIRRKLAIRNQKGVRAVGPFRFSGFGFPSVFGFRISVLGRYSPGAPISSIMSRPPCRPPPQLWPRMCFLAGSEAVHVLGIGKPLNQKARRALPLCASLGRHFLQPAANNETVKCIGNVHGSAIY